MIAAYHRLLFDSNPDVHGPAGVAWTSWEANGITLLPDVQLIAHLSEPSYALAFARIESHYFVNDGWFDDGQLLRDAHRLAGIPGVIVQGRYDMCTPAVTAWDLHREWPSADLVLVPDAGHAFSEPGIQDALLEATDRLAAG
jgi:proline iminopeptidase